MSLRLGALVAWCFTPSVSTSRLSDFFGSATTWFIATLHSEGSVTNCLGNHRNPSQRRVDAKSKL